MVTTVVSEVKLSFNIKTNIFLYLNNKNETTCFDPVFGSSSGQEILEYLRKMRISGSINYESNAYLDC